MVSLASDSNSDQVWSSKQRFPAENGLRFPMRAVPSMNPGENPAVIGTVPRDHSSGFGDDNELDLTLPSTPVTYPSEIADMLQRPWQSGMHESDLVPFHPMLEQELKQVESERSRPEYGNDLIRTWDAYRTTFRTHLGVKEEDDLPDLMLMEETQREPNELTGRAKGTRVRTEKSAKPRMTPSAGRKLTMEANIDRILSEENVARMRESHSSKQQRESDYRFPQMHAPNLTVADPELDSRSRSNLFEAVRSTKRPKSSKRPLSANVTKSEMRSMVVDPMRLKKTEVLKASTLSSGAHILDSSPPTNLRNVQPHKKANSPTLQNTNSSISPDSTYTLPAHGGPWRRDLQRGGADLKSDERQAWAQYGVRDPGYEPAAALQQAWAQYGMAPHVAYNFNTDELIEGERECDAICRKMGKLNASLRTKLTPPAEKNFEDSILEMIRSSFAKVAILSDPPKPPSSPVPSMALSPGQASPTVPPALTSPSGLVPPALISPAGIVPSALASPAGLAAMSPQISKAVLTGVALAPSPPRPVILPRKCKALELAMRLIRIIGDDCFEDQYSPMQDTVIKTPISSSIPLSLSSATCNPLEESPSLFREYLQSPPESLHLQIPAVSEQTFAQPQVSQSARPQQTQPFPLPQGSNTQSPRTVRSSPSLLPPNPVQRRTLLSRLSRPLTQTQPSMLSVIQSPLYEPDQASISFSVQDSSDGTDLSVEVRRTFMDSFAGPVHNTFAMAGARNTFAGDGTYLALPKAPTGLRRKTTGPTPLNASEFDFSVVARINERLMQAFFQQERPEWRDLAAEVHNLARKTAELLKTEFTSESVEVSMQLCELIHLEMRLRTEVPSNLWSAVRSNSPNVVEYLIEAQADITAVNSDEQTSLDVATQHGYYAIVRILTAAHAPTKTSHTPTKPTNMPEIIQGILNIELDRRRLNYGLFCAALLAREDICDYLLSLSADPNAELEGDSVLFVATLNPNGYRTMELLRTRGATYPPSVGGKSRTWTSSVQLDDVVWAEGTERVQLFLGTAVRRHTTR